MNPIIKWPGGKTRELGKLLPLIPPFRRYVEPFFGGGAMFFRLEPPCAAINDISASLMGFYRLIRDRDETLRDLLMCYDRSFTRLLELTDERSGRLLELFDRAFAGHTGREAAREELWALCREMAEPLAQAFGELRPDMDAFLETLLNSAADKLFRTVENHRHRPFSPRNLEENLVTGFAGGYYMYFRGLFNDMELGRLRDVSPQYRAANFYFVREYCYGSMFRYNAAGEFNIPYGGMSYNRKNLGAKLRTMWGPDIARLLSGAEIRSMDFQEFFGEIGLGETDFMFLDPPYDSDFSDYEGRDFTRRDQERLARALRDTKAKFLLVIKNTGFIRALYEGDFNILSFDKRYTYNVRSRNDRGAEHLIITNYLPEASGL